MKRVSALPSWLVDAALILLALTDAVVPLLWSGPADAAATVVAAAGLVLRRRWPWISVLLALPAVWLSAATIAALIALYSLTRVSSHRWMPLAAGVMVLTATANSMFAGAGIDFGGFLIALIYPVMTVAAPIALGFLVNARQELREQYDQLAEAREVEKLREREEILRSERARIAREMHDVVSHQVSLIAVQAGGLQVTAKEPVARELGGTIRTLAARTLDELRQMVSVLRAADSVRGSLQPQPTIEDIGQLIHEAGVSVDSTVALPASLPPAVQRALYRSIQEGLTNARKHAPGQVLVIRAWGQDAEVRLQVRNSVSPGAGIDLPSSGHGLLGLRERAELLGGSFQVVDERGQFGFEMRIPVESSS